MVRRITKRRNATLAKKHTKHVGKRYDVRGSGFKSWLKRAGRKIKHAFKKLQKTKFYKDLSTAAKFAKKNKLLSKALGALAVVDKRAAVPAGIAAAVGLGKCGCKKKCKKVCKLHKKQYMLLQHGNGLKPTGNGKRKVKKRRRRKVGAGLNP